MFKRGNVYGFAGFLGAMLAALIVTLALAWAGYIIGRHWPVRSLPTPPAATRLLERGS